MMTHSVDQRLEKKPNMLVDVFDTNGEKILSTIHVGVLQVK